MAKCFECSDEAHHNHHVVPVSKGGKKTIPLCLSCHQKVHGASLYIGNMVKYGQAVARKEGRYPGAPRRVSIEKVIALRKAGFSLKHTSLILGCSKGAVQAIVNKTEKGKQ